MMAHAVGGDAYPQHGAGGTVLLTDELDADDTPIFRRVALPPGDRAEARRQLVRDVLTKTEGPWMVGLIDFTQLLQHLVFVLGSKEPDGTMTVTEFAEHRGTERGSAIIQAIEETHHGRS